MTLRAKPVARRDARPPAHPGDRRNFYINLGFAISIVAAVVILVAALGLTWYNGHLAPAAKVYGETITKDEFATRYSIETFRIDYAEARLRTLVNLGYMTDDQESQQIQYINNSKSQLVAIALERVIDVRIQAKLASEAGITVTDAEIDAKFKKEATVETQRHAWVIEVQPERDPGVREPTAAQVVAAKAKADQALADLKAGKSWEDVASAVSTAEYGGANGDLGFLGASVTYDAVYLDAIFKAPLNTITGVLEGEDGTFRIGRATEEGAAQEDVTFQTRLTDAKIKTADYRAVIKADVIRDKLEAKVIADLSLPSAQRHIAEIYIADNGSAPSATAVKTRHVLYSPKNDPAGAAALAETDPAWKAAEDEARATYAKLKVDIGQFDAIARKDSDEASAKLTGGKLPYYDENSSIDPSYAAAILDTSLKPGDLLEPIRTSFGWDVIQIMHGPTDEQWAAQVRTQLDTGAKFSDLARDNSEGPGAAEGGDGGWISRGELTQQLEDAVFKTGIGGLSDSVVISGDGVYLVKVLAEETRSPTPAQIAVYKSTGFSNWYEPKKTAANVERLLTAGS